VRDAWEEGAAVVCALWSLCAVPVVIIDAVAMPGGFGFFLAGELTACGRGRGAYVPVKDVEAVDRHRSRVVSGEPLAYLAGADSTLFGKTNDGTRRSTCNLGRLFYHHCGQSMFAALSDIVRGTTHLGILIHDYALYEPLHGTMKHEATLKALNIQTNLPNHDETPRVYWSMAPPRPIFSQSSHLSRLSRH